ncbi:hypothetical protein [Campylobacter lanienae]|nr:hypothetical protein [Campylobacter lanienae]
MQLMLFDFILKNDIKNWRKLLSCQNKNSQNVFYKIGLIFSLIY